MNANIALADAVRSTLEFLFPLSHWIALAAAVLLVVLPSRSRRTSWWRLLLSTLLLCWWGWDQWDETMITAISGWVRIHPIMFTCGLIAAAGLSFMLGVVLMLWDAGRPVSEEQSENDSDLPPSFTPTRRPPGIRPIGAQTRNRPLQTMDAQVPWDTMERKDK